MQNAFILTLLISLICFCFYKIYHLNKKNSQLRRQYLEYKQKNTHIETLKNQLENDLQHEKNIVYAYEILFKVIPQGNLDIFQQLIRIIHQDLNLELSYFVWAEKNDQFSIYYLLDDKWQKISIKKTIVDNIFLLFKDKYSQKRKYFFDSNLEIIKRLNFSIQNIKKGLNFSIIHSQFNSNYLLGFYSNNINIFDDKTFDFIDKIISIIENGVDNNYLNQQFYLLRRAIDSCRNGVIIASAQEGNPIVFVNKGFENITGYSFEEIKGKNCRFLQKNDCQETEKKIFREAIQNKESQKIVLRNYRKNGEVFWNEVYISPVYNQEGKVINFIGIQNDITDKYITEQKLRKKTAEIETLNKQLNLVNKLNNLPSQNLQQVFNYYLEEITKILDLDVAIISEVFGYRVSITASYNRFSGNLENNIYLQTNELVDYLSTKVIQQQQIINTDFLKKDEFIVNKLEEFNIYFYLGIPIFINKKIYGILHFFNVNKNKANSNYSNSLIDSISQTISRIIISQEIELEKEQISVALKESQERLYDILSSLDDVIWSIHPQTLQLTYINQAGEKLFQTSLSKILKKRTYWLDLVNPQDKQKVQEYYANLFSISLLGDEVKSHDIEYGIILENGTEKYIRDRANIVYDEKGKKLRIDGILTDITNRTITKQALEKSEQEFRLIFELAPIGMIITDFDGNIIQVNNSLCDLLKYSAIDLLNKNEATFYHPDDQEKSSFFKHKIITENLDQYSEERRFLASNGSIVHTIVNITALRNNENKIIQFIQQIVDISELKVMEQQIFYDAFYDKLTGLPNRFLLTDRLKQFFNIRQYDSQKLCAILLIDVDKFKKINDSLGHKIGDELLRIIADKIVDCVTEKDTVARISSDEFIVLLPDITLEKEVYNIVEQIRIACLFNTTLQNQEVYSSVSIGVTLSSFGYKKAEEMIRDADIAMYHAKEKGGNCYQIFSASMHTDLLKRLNLESALVKALENEELELYYQPIINLKTGFIAGFEALIRWHSPSLGFISPVEFIPIAEETSLIIPLGNWILSQAVQQIEKWEKEYPNLELFIAVNVSSKQLLHPNFLDEIDNILEKNNINRKLLKIEITESILMDNFDYAKEVLEQIQERNLKISLDDFGTGYSSLSYLHRLPFNTLKIDRIFIQPLTSASVSSPIVEAIVNLAHNLSLDVVAEGIETEIQEQILKKINCNYGQGYLYSRPVNGRDADNLIKQWS
ncbi:EAL domain-containing protein [Cyanobacterium aponinum AL20118]|uniref:EAL domain-containing protein n=1 Tax=Cyanobacterium aponinum AL20115 TaxID=3090662 RepID=A0AAF0ZBR9_9CHRO|nr:EAL domain-containing protein [Cyanobacterium aponinum]WPF88049.1 EAL domain-containing protein [Cyanobacterium aponinum AL20115]